MRRARLVLLLFVALTPSIAAPQGSQADGTLYRWTGGQWVQEDGFGTRLAVAPDGTPWVVNGRNEIYRRVNGAFQKMPGGAADIAVGGDGSVWVIGTDTRVYQWAGDEWRPTNGGGIAISADQAGAAWVAAASGAIYRWAGRDFVKQEGGALDIAATGGVGVIGTDHLVCQLGSTGWDLRGGNGVRIAAGDAGSAWVVNDSGEIYQWSQGSFRRIPGTALDIAANANGDGWMVGAGQGQRGRQRRR